MGGELPDLLGGHGAIGVRGRRQDARPELPDEGRLELTIRLALERLGLPVDLVLRPALSRARAIERVPPEALAFENVIGRHVHLRRNLQLFE